MRTECSCRVQFSPTTVPGPTRTYARTRLPAPRRSPSKLALGSMKVLKRADVSSHDPRAAVLPVVSTGPQIHPTSIIESGVTLGRDVRVGPFTVIHANVSLGDGTFVDSHTVLGAPTVDYYDAEAY